MDGPPPAWSPGGPAEEEEAPGGPEEAQADRGPSTQSAGRPAPPPAWRVWSQEASRPRRPLRTGPGRGTREPQAPGLPRATAGQGHGPAPRAGRLPLGGLQEGGPGLPTGGRRRRRGRGRGCAAARPASPGPARSEGRGRAPGPEPTARVRAGHRPRQGPAWGRRPALRPSGARVPGPSLPPSAGRPNTDTHTDTEQARRPPAAAAHGGNGEAARPRAAAELKNAQLSLGSTGPFVLNQNLHPADQRPPARPPPPAPGRAPRAARARRPRLRVGGGARTPGARPRAKPAPARRPAVPPTPVPAGKPAPGAAKARDRCPRPRGRPVPARPGGRRRGPAGAGTWGSGVSSGFAGGRPRGSRAANLLTSAVSGRSHSHHQHHIEEKWRRGRPTGPEGGGARMGRGVMGGAGGGPAPAGSHPFGWDVVTSV